MSIMNRFSTVTFSLGTSLDDVIAATQHAEKLGFYSINIPMTMAVAAWTCSSCCLPWCRRPVEYA